MLLKICFRFNEKNNAFSFSRQIQRRPQTSLQRFDFCWQFYSTVSLSFLKLFGTSCSYFHCFVSPSSGFQQHQNDPSMLLVSLRKQPNHGPSFRAASVCDIQAGKEGNLGHSHCFLNPRRLSWTVLGVNMILQFRFSEISLSEELVRKIEKASGRLAGSASIGARVHH